MVEARPVMMALPAVVVPVRDDTTLSVSVPPSVATMPLVIPSDAMVLELVVPAVPFRSSRPELLTVTAAEGVISLLASRRTTSTLLVKVRGAFVAVAVAFAEIVTELAPTEVIVAPAGMPAPETVMPMARAAVDAMLLIVLGLTVVLVLPVIDRMGTP